MVICPPFLSSQKNAGTTNPQWRTLSPGPQFSKIFRKVLYLYIIYVLLFSPAKITEDARPHGHRSAEEGFVGFLENPFSYECKSHNPPSTWQLLSKSSTCRTRGMEMADPFCHFAPGYHIHSLYTIMPKILKSVAHTPSCSWSYRSQTLPHPPTHPMEQMLPKVTNDFLVLNPKDTVDHAFFLEIQFPTVFHNSKASCFSFYLSCYSL